MTCKGCLHYEVCSGHAFEEKYCDKDNCLDYTNRSEWVHLPCKVGDTVYYVDGAWYLKNKSMWEIKPIKVTEFSTKIGRSGKLYPLSIIANGTRYPVTSIGKTVFLTREEAEKALKEVAQCREY